MRAVNVTRNTVLAERADWAGTSGARRRGLLGRESFEPGEGLYLAPCQWVHMFGMRFAIDVAFLARDGRVLAVHHDLRPGRISKLVWRADGALELPAGTLAATGTQVGDVVEMPEDGG
jgi:uncharacterized membrane protein (UPF0127 family)